MDLGTTGGDDSVRAASDEVGDGREAVTGGGDPGYGGGDDDGGDDDGGKEVEYHLGVPARHPGVPGDD